VLNQLKDNERQIVNLLLKREKLTRLEVEKELGLRKSQTIDLIKGLRELSIVEQIGRGRSTYYMLKTQLKKCVDYQAI
jgi:predicted transcriptional regulator